MLQHKAERQLAVGPHATWCFEDRLTVQYQVQEMLRAERIFEPAGIAEELAAYNPLRRVPTLVLDDGEVLIESFVILDYLDERIGPMKALIARSGEPRRKALKVSALATGLAAAPADTDPRLGSVKGLAPARPLPFVGNQIAIRRRKLRNVPAHQRG